jgi:hypothetical protein
LILIICRPAGACDDWVDFGALSCVDPSDLTWEGKRLPATVQRWDDDRVSGGHEGLIAGGVTDMRMNTWHCQSSRPLDVTRMPVRSLLGS